MNTESKLGRAPVPTISKVIKSLAFAYDSLTKTEIEIELALGLDGSPRDKEIIAIKDRRIAINEELSPILERLFPLSRQKKLTKAESIELETLQNKKRDLHKELYDMPKIGMSESEWAEELENLKEIKSHGRPPKSVELRFVHARQEFNELEKKYRNLEKMPENKAFILKTFGSEGPVSIKEIHEVGFKQDKGKKSGRPSAGKITLLEKDLRIIRRKIVKTIGSKSKRKKKAVTSGMGRPAKSASDKLAVLREKEAELIKKIESVELKMTDIEILNRKIASYRKEVKAQKDIVEASGLDEKEDFNHPVVVEYNRMNYVLAMIVSKRAIFTKEADIIEAFGGDKQEHIADKVSTEVKTNVLSDDLKDKIRAKKEAYLKMEKAKSIKEHILAQKKLSEAKEEAEQNSLDSETEALKNII